jgi:hypothetical protein
MLAKLRFRHDGTGDKNHVRRRHQLPFRVSSSKTAWILFFPGDSQAVSREFHHSGEHSSSPWDPVRQRKEMLLEPEQQISGFAAVQY